MTGISNLSLSRINLRIILSVVLLFFLIYGYLSEKILAGEGYGFDGVIYGDITTNLIEYLRNKTLNKYYFQRIGVPFAILHIFELFNIAFSKANIIFAFEVINYVLIAMSVLYFFLISNLLTFSKNVEAIGFACMFFCFPVLKLCGYSPVLMDIPAFAIAVILVYYYLKQNAWLFFTLILLGSFVYPNFIILCVLFWFKKEDLNLSADHMSADSRGNSGVLKRTERTFIKFLFCFTLPIVLFSISCFLFLRDSADVVPPGFNLSNLATLSIWFSFTFALAYLVYFNFYSGINYTFKKLIKSVNLTGIVLTITVVVLIQFVIQLFASNEAVPLTMELYLYNIVFQCVRNPMNFFVAHLFYFGVLFLFMLIFPKKLKYEIKKFGFGAILFFNLFFFFSLGSESRQLINYYPFTVIVGVLALANSKRISTLSSLFIILTNILLSHFWYTINKGLSVNTNYSDYYSLIKFPCQRYFKFQGPWVSDSSYKVHLWVCLALLLVLFIIYRKLKPAGSKEQDLQ